jgi:hypothetical protein
MNSNHLTPDVDTDGTGGASPGGARAASDRRKPGCYVTLRPLLEVMEDQIRYLIDHAGKQCLPGCADCARLEEAKRCLLRPFA